MRNFTKLKKTATRWIALSTLRTNGPRVFEEILISLVMLKRQMKNCRSMLVLESVIRIVLGVFRTKQFYLILSDPAKNDLSMKFLFHARGAIFQQLG